MTIDRWGTIRGFTIVELLIVIVVIAILAVVTIVGYNGVTNRASDAAVKSDLAQVAKKLEQQRIDDGTESYPIVVADFTFVVPFNKAQYAIAPTLVFNGLICQENATFSRDFLILSTSKSGKRFMIASGGGITEYTGAVSWTGSNANTICVNMKSAGWVGAAAAYRSTDLTTGPWRAWAGGN